MTPISTSSSASTPTSTPTSEPSPSGGLAITSEDLLVVLADLWEATFECGIRAVDATPPDASPRWWAAVELLDDDGVVAEVVVVVDEPALAAVACVTFGVDDPEPDQMTDVAAEAANIVGGNVKGILSLRTRLSWPRAGTGAPSLGPAPRTSVHAIDDRGRRLEAHVIHTSSGAGSAGTAGNEE